MDPLTSPIVDVGSLVAAIEAEAQYPRIWLPPEPWWDALVTDKAAFANALHRKVVRGTLWPRSETVDVRKPGHGIRPVLLMGPEVRVLYRAIVSALVSPDARADRSAERYAEFVVQPIRAGFDSIPGLKRISDATFRYVVTADIAAFYQYV